MTRAELETTARIKRDTLRGLLDEMTDRPPRPKRKRSFSQVAALLPPVERVRFPRATTSPPLGRGSSSNMTRAEQKAAQTIADARAKLDRIEQESEFPVLSHQIVANLSGEEMSMLPMEIRLRMPQVASWETPPAIEMTTGDDCITIHSVLPREVPVIEVEMPVRRPPMLALIALFFGAFVVGLLGAYVVS
jgi:hypothetical protein